MWRALSGDLGVVYRLNSQGILIDTLYSSGDFEPSSICHILLNADCSVALQASYLAEISFHRLGFSWNNVFLNLSHLVACCKNHNIPEKMGHALLWIFFCIFGSL